MYRIIRLNGTSWAGPRLILLDLDVLTKVILLATLPKMWNNHDKNSKLTKASHDKPFIGKSLLINNKPDIYPTTQFYEVYDNDNYEKKETITIIPGKIDLLETLLKLNDSSK